jgi:hypothetical protein
LPRGASSRALHAALHSQKNEKKIFGNHARPQHARILPSPNEFQLPLSKLAT